MKLSILISTYGTGIYGLDKVLLPPMDDVSYVVSCQQTAQLSEALSEIDFLQRPDVRLWASATTGISANRNESMAQSDADIAWIMDDDVRLTAERVLRLKQCFEEHPECDVACFQIQTPEGQSYRSYPEAAFRMKSIEDVRNVSSIEIAFRLSAINERKLRFDERFGLGRPWPCSEEFLFLVACLRAGLRIDYFPYPVVEHPLMSGTKQRSQYEPSMLEKSGAVNTLLYGRWRAYLRNAMSLLKARKLLKKEGLTACEFLKYKNKGSRMA